MLLRALNGPPSDSIIIELEFVWALLILTVEMQIPYGYSHPHTSQHSQNIVTLVADG